MPKRPPIDRCVTVAAVSEATGLHEDTIRAALRAGELRASKVGRRWIIPAEAVKEWTELHSYDPAEPERAALIGAARSADIARVREALVAITARENPLALPPRNGRGQFMTASPPPVGSSARKTGSEGHTSTPDKNTQ